MKTLKNLLGCAGLWLISLFTQAEPCRAHQAAQIGSQMGYEQAKKAADAWEKREQYATTALQQCLGSLSTSLTVPTFPDLSSLLNGIKDKVCAAGREKISRVIPSHINPWEEWTVADYSIPTKTLSASQTILPDPKKGSPFTLN
ncbi:hypothetical protein [Candidatus Williamhamiltonella defendens]|uniref:TraL conjugal transfer protein n=1 Tax=Hamiltonella defensa subsp. Acyrthosiphon pisum (strain 5AT) TaxID=572265 RepID=C4K525_HAMD5|nr:hypothetical protein [Candidatus Hamiltonella defensa]ACQ67668.1 TraL conjugal transfer protein [Candidatus Hamiltonella defensa 5AT (Acyrthosiphon pisum)]